MADERKDPDAERRSVEFGAVLDFSGSMRAAWRGAGNEVRLTESLFDTLNSLVEVGREEARKPDSGRINIFASAVGVHQLPGRPDQDTCDLLSLVEAAEDLLARRDYTLDEMVNFAKEFGEKGVAGEWWIRKYVKPDEVTPLMRYVVAHREDAKRLVNALPGTMVTLAAKAAQAASRLVPLPPTMSTQYWSALTAYSACSGAPAIVDSGTASAPNPVAEIVNHEAFRMKNEFIGRQRDIDRRGDGNAVDAITERPIPRHVADLSSKLRSQLTSEQARRVVKLLEPFVYGSTPLAKALGHARDVFRASTCTEKVLFILSDGIASDNVNGAVDLAREMQAMGVRIVTCYLTTQRIDNPRRLHYAPPEDDAWSPGARALFDMASPAMRNVELPVSLAVLAGWEVPGEGECRLFLRANNLEVVNDFNGIMQTAFVRNPEEAALGMAGKINWGAYTLPTLCRDAEVQHQGSSPTCWAHAIGTVVHLATLRVMGREGGELRFEDVKQSCFDAMSTGTFDASKSRANTAKALAAVTPRYRQHFKPVTEAQARQALNHHRPVVATFRLYDHPDYKARTSGDPEEEWARFVTCVSRNPTRALLKTDVQCESPLVSVCVCVCVRVCGCGCVGVGVGVGVDVGVRVLCRLRAQASMRLRTSHECSSHAALVPNASPVSQRAYPNSRWPGQASISSGHAVVLIAAGPDWLEFQNSWGRDFGSRGRFRVRDASVLREMQFFDVFWYEHELTDGERRAWQLHCDAVMADVKRKYPTLAKVLYKDRAQHK